MGGPLPNNSTAVAPEIMDGFIPRWNGTAWELLPDLRGLEGWLDGRPHTITEYGPLPPGWSDEPPPPTPEDLAAARIEAIKARLDTIDKALIRGLDARDEGTATEEDEAKLAELRAEKRKIRAEMKALEGTGG